jgi:hypothetical protein
VASLLRVYRYSSNTAPGGVGGALLQRGGQRGLRGAAAARAAGPRGIYSWLRSLGQ